MVRWGLWAATLVVAAGVGLIHAEDQKPEKKSGTLTGIVTAKDKNTIDVKADGEEKARKYFPRWVGGNPAQGGGLDKDTLKTFADLKIGSRIRMEWEFEERPRAVKIEVLKDAPKKDNR